jgi:hypothetical protein
MDDLVQTLWTDPKDEWFMVVGGGLPEIGTILEHRGEQVQVLGHGVRVTRGFQGKPSHHTTNNYGPCGWRVVAKPNVI